MPTTVRVALDMMIHHASAVMRTHPSSLVITDLPFPEAHRSQDRLLAAAARCLQETGCDGVKIEGGAGISPKIARLVDAGIPILGHIGLLPQQVLQLGGYRKFGKTPEEREKLLEDALAIEKAGAFAIVIEMTEPELTREITKQTRIPIIGIGAGPDCDGQILVAQDILGLTQGKVPSFAKAYTKLCEQMKTAFETYADDVRQRKFPS